MGLYLIILHLGKCFAFEYGTTYADIDYLSLLIGWFLPVLFAIEIIAYIIIILTIRKKYYLYLTAIATGTIFYHCEITSFVYIPQIEAGLFFFLVGYLFRPILDEASSGKLIFIGCFSILFVAFLSTLNIPVGMYMNQYGNKINFLVTAVLGILSIAFIAQSMKSNAILQWIGKRSLQIYVLHGGIVMLTRLIVERTLGNSHVYPNYLIQFLITILLLIPLILFADKYMSFIFGNFRTKGTPLTT